LVTQFSCRFFLNASLRRRSISACIFYFTVAIPNNYTNKFRLIISANCGNILKLLWMIILLNVRDLSQLLSLDLPMLHIKHPNKEHPTYTIIGWTQQCFLSHTNWNMPFSDLKKKKIHRTQNIMFLYSHLYSATKAKKG
jgi:hypothetical protein